MKKVALALFVAFVSVSSTFAGENPKLLKEIQRKITIDLSGIHLEKSKEHFVSVRFRVVDQEIEIVNLKGSERKLTDLMLCELEEMFINADANPDKIYQFKFRFSQE